MQYAGQSQNAEISDAGNIWEAGRIRLFISHKSEDRDKARDLKGKLQKFSVTSFVAHEDVDPTEEWENVILEALSTMDILVALLTEDASRSHWVNQEIGYAFGRNKPVVSVGMGADPQGFNARHQALSGQGREIEHIADELFSLMFEKDRLGLKEPAKDSFIAAIRNANSFIDAASLSKFLPKIDSLTPTQIEKLLDSYNRNYQASGSYDFRPDLLQRLNELSNSGETYRFVEDHNIAMDRYEDGMSGVVQPISEDDLPS